MKPKWVRLRKISKENFEYRFPCSIWNYAMTLSPLTISSVPRTSKAVHFVNFSSFDDPIAVYVTPFAAHICGWTDRWSGNGAIGSPHFFFCKRNIRFFFDAEHHQRPTISNRRVMMKQNRIASKAALKETRYARIEIQWDSVFIFYLKKKQKKRRIQRKIRLKSRAKRGLHPLDDYKMNETRYATVET